MKKLILGLLLAAGVISQASAALPNTSATLTADNHYGLFLGNASGSNLQFIGRNEFGNGGSPGSFNWSLPETYQFNASPGDYLYVLAWDDGGPQAWIGSFNTPAGALTTNTTDWVVKYTTTGNPGVNGNVPSNATVASLIGAGSWSAVNAQAANGSGPWGTIAGVGAAKFIWHDTLSDNSSSDHGFALFRSANAIMAPVPEPETYAMLLAGLGLMGAVARRRRTV